jgi:two-component system OmpR family sensor kinase
VDPRLDTVVLLAMPLDDVDDAVNRLVRVEIAVTAAILAVLGLVAWWVIHLGIRPIKQMTATATAIAGGELSHRVAEGDPHTEAGELGVALNNMLGRIEQAFDERTETENRLRRFVADASHELRTPVTTIRGYAELFRDGGLTDEVELGEAMRRTEQEAVRMGSLVDDLLLLARLDQGRPLEREPVDLRSIVADAARDAAAVDPHRPIATAVDGPAVVLGDEGRVRQVVANLVSNALVHTPAGTPVELRLRHEDGHAVLEVSDRGPGMSPESAARAFERFYRADPSRSRHRGGSGLGLAIVQATIEAHGGSVSLRSGPGQGTTVTVQLPLAP